MKIHELKTWRSYFKAVKNGSKTFEIRKNDRNFKAGDMLRLKEYDLYKESFTGMYIDVIVTYVLSDNRFIKDGYVCMGIKQF